MTNILQFGEGNFLRGFFNWGLQNLRNVNEWDGKLTVITPIDSDFIIDKLNNQNLKYNVVLAGIQNGAEVFQIDQNETISEAYNISKSWENILTNSATDSELKVIISNTTEAGIVYDESCKLDDELPTSFPAKITQLLLKRFNSELNGLYILPCELIDKNGSVLKEYILKYASDWDLGIDFEKWVDEECVFFNTLVDRIVPGYPAAEADELCKKIGWNDELIVKTEPFAFFGIEPASGNSEDIKKLDTILPLSKADLGVKYTSNLKPFRERKVHLLNAPHTAMSMLGIPNGIETVKEMVTVEPYKTKIHNLMFNEIVPVLVSDELTEKELIEFANAVWDRFLNPFNRHELSSISLNEQSKYEVRVLPIIKLWQKKVPSILSELKEIAAQKWGI